MRLGSLSQKCFESGIFGILLHLHMPLQYIIAMLIAFGVAFAVTWVIWKPEEENA